MPKVVHFEIPADNPERAIEFYGGVFGWKANKWDGPQDYWLMVTGEEDQPGINGGMMKREQPDQGVCNTLDVPSVEEFSQKVEAAGGKVVAPRMAIPGVGYVAYCHDTEGNLFGIFESDESAQAA